MRNGETENSKDFWDSGILIEAAERFGTPLFVFDPSKLENAYKNINKEFELSGLSTKLFYSVKTNHLPEVLCRLKELDSGVEVINEFELWLVLKLGFKPENILINGFPKSKSFVNKAIEIGVGLFCVDSLEELNALTEISDKTKRGVNLSIRINPRLKKAPFDFTLLSGNAGSGFSVNSNELYDAIKVISKNRWLNLIAMNFHIGSGIANPKPYNKALKKIFPLWKRLEQEGFKLKILDIGGGFGIQNTYELTLPQVIKRFLLNSGLPPAKNIKRDLFKSVAENIKDLFMETGNNNESLPKIYLEPGRALIGSSHVLLLKAAELNDSKRKSIFLNGGAMNISPLLLSEYHEIGNLSNDGEDKIFYNIFGGLPTPLDIVAKKRKLSEIHGGDILGIWDTGAYFIPFNNNFGGPRPAAAVVDNGKIKLIRKRESFDEVISRDIYDRAR